MGLRANLRALRRLYQRLRDRGHGPLATVLWRMPQAAAWRAYRKMAYAINDNVLQRWVTPARFRRFQAGLADRLGGHFYVIVMPHTLHFLLPCLRLIGNDLPVILLVNGASAWEAELLASRWPDLPRFRVATLPGSSASHGAMINLLLRHNDRDFGLLDHDLYLFDKALLAQLRFGRDEFLLCLFSDTSADGRWHYPLTHFLYFRVAVFQRLMQQYGVGAQLYRCIPRSAREGFAALGLGSGQAMKSYHDFFDTLHVLIALAYAEGLGVGQIDLDGGDGAYHVGGTSIGTHHTKALVDLYIHLRFLEFTGEPLLQRRYAMAVAPFTSAAELRARLPSTPKVFQQLQVIDKLFARLQVALETDHSPPPRVDQNP